MNARLFVSLRPGLSWRSQMWRSPVRSFTSSAPVLQEESRMLADLLRIGRKFNSPGSADKADSGLRGLENLPLGLRDLRIDGQALRRQDSSSILDKPETVNKISDFPVSQIPRTGVMAGRSTPVHGASGLSAALRNLNMINQANRIRRVVSLQRYHERPGKVKQRLRQEKARRKFDEGIRRLFGLVNEARRKGY